MPKSKRDSPVMAYQSDGRMAIYVYDDVDMDFGFSARQLRQELSGAMPDDDLVVYINSAGGDVKEGLAIYNTLSSWRGEVTTVNMGEAGSIASLILLAGDVRQVFDNSTVLVHGPAYSNLSGTRKDIAKGLDRITAVDKQVFDVYKSKLNVEDEELTEWLETSAMTTFNAQRAKEVGFATEVVETLSAVAISDLVAFTNRYGERTDMKFEQWLKDVMHLDAKELTKQQLAALHTQFAVVMKASSGDSDSGDSDNGSDNSDDGSGDNQDDNHSDNQNVSNHSRQSLQLHNNTLRSQRQRAALEMDRQDAIQNKAQEFGDRKLNADYLKQLKVRGKTSRALASHAVREGWSVDKFELEMHRAELQDHGHVGIHSTPSIHELDSRALSCRLAMNAGVPLSRRSRNNPDRQWGLEHWESEQVLDAADDKRIRDLSLQQVLDMAVVEATGSRYHGRTNTDGFIQAVRDSQWKLRMANTTWGGLNIFDDAANKMLWNAYEAQNTTWQEWVRTEPVNDFKTHNIYRLTAKGSYLKVGADGELKHRAMTDDKYTVSADTFGEMVGLTRRDIINDDLGALNRIMAMLGIEGARFLEELFYAYFLDQQTTIFPTGGTYSNYVSGASTNLGVDGLTTVEKYFRNQVDDDGAPILVEPEILLVGSTLAVPAAELYRETALVGLQAEEEKVRPDGNPHVGKFRPVVSPYIDNTSLRQRTDSLDELGDSLSNQSATQYFLLAGPNNPQGAVIVGAFLNGNQRPTIEQADQSFNVLGLQWRAYHDAGVGTGDPKLGVHCKGSA